MIYHFENPIIWHVVFHAEPRWWAKKYHHVSLAGRAEGTWVNLDLHRKGVSISTIYKYDEVNDYLSFLLTHYTVVRFGPVDELKGAFLRPMTCVQFVKHALGVRSSALRPDGLLTTLLRDYDGVLLNETQDAQGDARPDCTPATG